MLLFMNIKTNKQSFKRLFSGVLVFDVAVFILPVLLCQCPSSLSALNRYEHSLIFILYFYLAHELGLCPLSCLCTFILFLREHV